jgi:hypothetical protein
MSNVVLTLGGVSFQDMEVPEKIRFGGQQRLSVQSLIGGGRVVQALGLDDGVISFSGIFSGADAVGRAQLLDTARALGAVLPLVWDRFFYSVVIRDFVAEYRETNLIPFAVTCVVVVDPLADVAVLAAPVASLVAQDLTAAAALSGQAGVSVASVTAGSLAGFSALQGVLSATMAASGRALLTDVAALGAASDPAAGVAAVGRVSAACSQLAGLGAMTGYVGRAAVNIGNELV